jgi:hypothetical protein
MEKVSSKQIVTKPTSIEVFYNILSITIGDKTHEFDISKISDRLFSASEAVRKHFILSPSGYGIHWPDIDEDISIPALLKSYHS